MAFDPSLVSAIDQEATQLRRTIESRWPEHAQFVQEPGAWHDGALLAIVDLLEHRGDCEDLHLRLLAWDRILCGEAP